MELYRRHIIRAHTGRLLRGESQSVAETLQAAGGLAALSATIGAGRPLESRVGQDGDSDSDIVAFVRAAISSVCALELLILLRRERQQSIRLDRLVRELRSSELAVAQALEHLAKSGLIEELPGASYRYQQVSAQLDAICDRLESLYARKPVMIVRAILDAPNEKLRTFSDAFRLSGKTK